MGLNLYYKDVGGWIPLPDWSVFFISLGEKLSWRLGKNKKWTVALALPARAYIAPFIGVGILSSIFKIHSPSDLLSDHFQTLASLEKNTSVLYRKNSRILKGKYLGVADFQGEKRLLIQIQSAQAGGLTEYIAKKNALNIQVNPNQNQRLPSNQRGRKMTKNDSRLTNAFFGLHSQIFLRQSRTRICFVGGKEFEREVTKNMFAVCSDNQMIQGSLNDLLRVKQFQHKFDPYQSQFVSSAARSKNIATLNLSPDSIVVYSGSNGYLNWKESLLRTNSIIILDRSDAQFEIAFEEINNSYIQSSRIPTTAIELGKVPAGIEILYWEQIV